MISANLGVWLTRIRRSKDARSMVRLSQTTRSVQPLWRSHVDLNVIGLAGEDALADLDVGGGEEYLRRLEMEPEVLLRCD